MVSLFCTLRQIVLASQSPRRQDFLKELGIEYILFQDLFLTKEKRSHSIFEKGCPHGMRSCGVKAKDDKEERPKPLELPKDYVFRVALGKVLDAMHDTGFIKSADIDTVNSVNSEKMAVNTDFIDTVGVRTLLDTDKKEILNLSYAVEKYHFKPNAFCSENSFFFDDFNKDGFNKALFITADTIVALDDEILGKPQDEADALHMLQRMVGREHKVLSSVCVADLEEKCVYSFTDIAYVHFAPWSTPLLESYIKTGDSMDKAGSYGIQGIGMFLSDGIKGSWDTVAGLPVAKLLELLLYCKAIHE